MKLLQTLLYFHYWHTIICTDIQKFRNLNSAVSDLATRLNKIVFEITNTDTIFRINPNHGIHVMIMTPKKYISDNSMLKESLDTATRTFIKYLEGINKSVWNHRYPIEIDNSASSDDTDPFVLVENRKWNLESKIFNNRL